MNDLLRIRKTDPTANFAAGSTGVFVQFSVLHVQGEDAVDAAGRTVGDDLVADQLMLSIIDRIGPRRPGILPALHHIFVSDVIPADIRPKQLFLQPTRSG